MKRSYISFKYFEKFSILLKFKKLYKASNKYGLSKDDFVHNVIILSSIVSNIFLFILFFFYFHLNGK